MNPVKIEISSKPQGCIVQKQYDLFRSIQADLFCLKEAIDHMHPWLATKVNFQYADIVVVGSGDTAVVRVFGVADPYELSLTVDDALISYVWRLHPEYGWYPDIRHDETEDWIREDVLPVILADIGDQDHRNYGTFKQRLQGQRSYIAYGQMEDRQQAYDWMLLIRSAYDYIDEVEDHE